MEKLFKKLSWFKHGSGVVHAHPKGKGRRLRLSLCGRQLAGTPLEIGMFEIYCESCKYSPQNGDMGV